MNAPEPHPDMITFELNGTTVTAQAGETILEAAGRHGVDIPRLCYSEGMRADGNCRSCVVEIDGERVLAPSCCRLPTQDMRVQSASDRARTAQRLVIELLRSDVPDTSYRLGDELAYWSESLDVGRPRFPSRRQPPPDTSHPAIEVRLDACIQCTRCVRACREVQANDVIGYAQRGGHARIVFDMGDAMGRSSCVGCGECVQVCPTGALAPAGNAALQPAEKQVDSVCPYCGVGCQLTFHVNGSKILRVDGRDGPANHNRLCVKGRYGFDYVHHPDRLTKPLIRREGVSKDLDPQSLTHEQMMSMFREATWEEALSAAVAGFDRIRTSNGGGALAGFGSAKGSNEEAYLFQKLVRTAFGTNNVDHCTRLCHASSVVALLEMIGSGAVSNPVSDVADADVIVVIGANPTENHPVAATFMKNASRAGKTLIVLDPRKTGLARHADYFLQFKPDTDVALLNAIMHAIVEENLVDQEFVARRTHGYDELVSHLQDFSPEAMAPLTGVDAATIRNVARVYASASASIIFWGMGVSQHVHGTDNSRALISLALLAGQIGRPGTGLHPLRGQNNVQGASDVGLIPMVFPDYQQVANPDVRAHFEQLWDTRLDSEPGLTVVEVMHAIHAGSIHGMYIMGENPAMSDPNVAHARQALAKLDHLVVQDIFLTETACYADVILPASAFPEKTGSFTNTDRRVQLGRQAIEPPGEARQDLWIIQEIGRRLGLDWNYSGPEQVFEEMRRAMPSIAGISWNRLNKHDAVTYPCPDEQHPGDPILFKERFPTPDGLAQFVPAPLRNAAELPDESYPFILITGRQLEHWHTGAMTRRASVLDAIEPDPVATLHPQDLAALDLQPGDALQLHSRRGRVEVYARTDSGLQRGQVFLPFCYREAAANLLTNESLDPDAKIPEFKFCAVRISRANQKR